MQIKRNCKNALTLIEVVASLVLLATTVTALLATHSRSLQQLTNINQQETAASLAQELITEWQLDESESEPPPEGNFKHKPGWRWVRDVIPYEPTYTNKINQITLKLFYQRDHEESEIVTRITWLERVDES